MQATTRRKVRSGHPGALMRSAFVTLTAIGLLTAAGASFGVPGQQSSARDLLREAMHHETALGDPDRAIALYEEILRAVEPDPDTMARAGLRLANLYEKLGEPDAARHSLRRVLEASNVGNEHLSAAREALVSLEASSEESVAAAPQILPQSGGVDWDISPDGRFGAFTAYLSAGQNIGVIDYTTGDKTWITDLTWETGMADYPVWSPDSRYIAYSYSQISADGVSEIRVAEPGGSARVVYASRKPGRFSVLVGDWFPEGRSLAITELNGNGSATVGVLELESGEFRALRTLPTTGHTPQGPPSRPRVSPDGRFLVIRHGVTEEDRDLYVLAVDGSSMERLTQHPAREREAFWSRDGSEVLFVSNRLGDETLWSIPVRGRSPTASAYLVPGGVAGARYRWVGDRLSYDASVTASDIFTVQLDASTGAIVGPQRQAPYQPTGSNSGPVFSPDGSDLAFFSEPDGRARIVLLRGGTDAVEFRIPDGLRPWGSPDFTPDGSHISLVSRDRGGHLVLGIVDLVTGRWEVEPVSDRMHRLRFEWAADNRSYYYVGTAEDESTFIARGELGSTESATLYEAPPPGPRNIQLTPDASELLFLEEGSLRALDLTSGAVRQVAAVPRFGNAALSPDGDKLLMIYFAEGATIGEGRLAVLELATGDLQVLDVQPRSPFATTEATLSEPARFYLLDWSPAGDRIAFGVRASMSARHLIPDPLQPEEPPSSR